MVLDCNVSSSLPSFLLCICQFLMILIFDFKIVNFPFLEGDVAPRSTLYDRIIRFARASRNVSDLTPQ